jgi:hypothetical protein
MSLGNSYGETPRALSTGGTSLALESVFRTAHDHLAWFLYSASRVCLLAENPVNRRRQLCRLIRYNAMEDGLLMMLIR